VSFSIEDSFTQQINLIDFVVAAAAIAVKIQFIFYNSFAINQVVSLSLC